jgi:hypothetical protein
MNSESFKEARETVQRLAKDAFKDHVMSGEGDGRWLCKRPGTGVYHFRLITAPGAVMVIGDLGEFVLRISDRDPIPWLRGSVNSFDYLVEKVQASRNPKEEFYPVDCLRWLREYAGGHEKEPTKRNRSERRDMAEALREARTAHQHREFHEHEWFRIAQDHNIDDVYDVGRYPSSDMVWLAELLKCFIRLHDASQLTEAA